MAKGMNQKKETKKKPEKTLKEKRAEKACKALANRRSSRHAAQPFRARECPCIHRTRMIEC